MTLADLYAHHAATPSDIQGHLPFFVDVVHELNAQHVVELGTRTGVSTVAWLHALEATGGKLTSIDLDPRPDLGEWPHWTFIQGDDLDPRIVGALEPADVVFIDTSHLYWQTVNELGVYRHLVRPGGLLLLHDMELDRPEGAPPFPRYPVRKAVLEFCAAEQLPLLERPGSWGLAVIQIR